jgi:hypothetical protein
MKSLNDVAEYIPAQLPKIMIMLDSLQDTITSINNLPLIRDGIPKQLDTNPGSGAPRDVEH